MKNLIGEENGIANLVGVKDAYAKFDNLQVHFYGKKEVRIGRKMGHITACADTVDQAINIVNEASQIIRISKK